MMKKFLAGIALIGTAATVQAADLPVKAPYLKAPVAMVYDWSSRPGFLLDEKPSSGFAGHHHQAGHRDVVLIAGRQIFKPRQFKAGISN